MSQQLGLGSIDKSYGGMNPEAINTMKQEGSPMATPPMASQTVPLMAPSMGNQGITPLLDALVEERLIKEKKEKASQMALSMGINPNSVVDQNKQELRELTQREMVNNALKVSPKTTQQLATIRRNAAKTLNKNFGLPKAPIEKPMTAAGGGIVGYDNGGSVERPSFLSNVFGTIKENPVNTLLGVASIFPAVRGASLLAKGIGGLGGLASKSGIAGKIGRGLRRGYTIPTPSPYSALKVPKVGATSKVNIPQPRQFSLGRTLDTASLGTLGALGLKGLLGGAEQPPTVTPATTTTETATTPKKKGILSPIGNEKQQQTIKEMAYILGGGPQNIASRSINVDTLKKAGTMPSKDVLTAYNAGMNTLADINTTISENVGDLARTLPEGQALRNIESDIAAYTEKGKEAPPELIQARRNAENSFILAADKALGGGGNVMGLYQQQMSLSAYLQNLQARLGMASVSGFDPSKGAEVVG